MTPAPSSRITAVQPVVGGRGRPRHHQRRRLSASSPSLPEVRLGGVRATRRSRLAPVADRHRPAGPRRRPHARPGRQRAGRDRLRRDRRAARDRRAPGRQPGLRSRGQPLRHLQRVARPGGAGLDLRRAPRRHRASRSSSGCRTRRRWRSIREGRLHVSSRFDGSVYRVDAVTDRSSTVATDLGVACGIAFDRDGDLFVGDRSGSILRVQRRAGDGLRRASRRAWPRSTWRSVPTAGST